MKERKEVVVSPVPGASRHHTTMRFLTIMQDFDDRGWTVVNAWWEGDVSKAIVEREIPPGISITDVK